METHVTNFKPPKPSLKRIVRPTNATRHLRASPVAFCAEACAANSLFQHHSRTCPSGPFATYGKQPPGRNCRAAIASGLAESLHTLNLAPEGRMPSGISGFGSEEGQAMNSTWIIPTCPALSWEIKQESETIDLKRKLWRFSRPFMFFQNQFLKCERCHSINLGRAGNGGGFLHSMNKKLQNFRSQLYGRRFLWPRSHL